MAVDVTQHSASAASRTVADLSEDRLTTWAPDVAADVDIPYLAQEQPPPTSGREVMSLCVPTPSGGQMRVPVVHPALVVALHDATSNLRTRADELLGTGVFGYRYGACDGWHYAQAWRAFSDETTTLAHSHAWVAFTDVSSFFAHSRWEHVLDTARALNGGEQAALATTAERFEASGQHSLPSGYADARFLSNLLLTDADRRIEAPFVRWVDDYRVFADSEREARSALGRVHAGMRRAGLEPNAAKTRIIPAEQAAEQHQNTLASVYHPERDSREVVRANLTRVLDRAVKDPVGRRRDLRFALSRLGREQDPSAVGWALRALTEIPWEAARLVGYLSSFAESHEERERIAAAIENVLVVAAESGDEWLISRLVPLAWHGKIEERTAYCLARALDRVDGSPAWGLALRLIARAGLEKTVREAEQREASDRRGLLAALAEIGAEPPGWLVEAEPCLARALRDGPLPAPKSSSLL